MSQEYSGASDLRRRSFLKLLGLAGVAATINPASLLEPAAAEVEAAKAAGLPVSGEFWVKVPTWSQARRLGKMVSTDIVRNPFHIERPIIECHTIHAGYATFEGPQETRLDIVLDEFDYDQVREIFENFSEFQGDVYLYGKKFTAGICHIHSLDVTVPHLEDAVPTVDLGISVSSQVKFEDFST